MYQVIAIIMNHLIIVPVAKYILLLTSESKNKNVLRLNCMIVKLNYHLWLVCTFW